MTTNSERLGWLKRSRRRRNGLCGGCHEKVMVAGAEQNCGYYGLRQHLGEGVVDHALARELAALSRGVLGRAIDLIR